MVRRRRGHARRPARERLRPRRRRPDARRLPARVEQAAPAADRLAARRRRRRRGDLREDARRHRRRLGAAVRRAGRDTRRGARRLPGPAHPHARGQRGRLRADHATLVDAGAADAHRAGRGGPPAVPRLLEHPLPGEPPERPPAHARGRGRPLDRPRGTTGPARRARALPGGADARLVGELPLLRRPGRVGATQCRGARDGRDASLERDRAPGERPGHAARAPAARALRLPAERRRPCGAGRRRGASSSTSSIRSASPRTTSCARSRPRPTPSAASTCWARQRR